MSEPARVKPTVPLSRQQLRCAGMLADGLSMREIGVVLDVEWYTVRYHVETAAKKIPGGAWPPSVKLALWWRGASLALLEEAPGARLRRQLLITRLSKA